MPAKKFHTFVAVLYGKKRSHKVPEGWTPIDHTVDGRFLYVDGFVYDIAELDEYGLETTQKPRAKRPLAKPRPLNSPDPRPAGDQNDQSR